MLKSKSSYAWEHLLKTRFCLNPTIDKGCKSRPKNASAQQAPKEWAVFIATKTCWSLRRRSTDVWTQLLTISDFLGGKSPWENKRHHPNDMSWTRKPRHLNHYNFRFLLWESLGYHSCIRWRSCQATVAKPKKLSWQDLRMKPMM